MKRPRKHFVIPDCQVRPGDNLDFLTACGRYIAEKRPDSIINLGDFGDMASITFHEDDREWLAGKSYIADVEAVIAGMTALCKPFQGIKGYNPTMDFMEGNHEYLIERLQRTNPKLRGLISIDDLRYREVGWTVHPFLRPHKIDGVVYSHYMVSGVMGKPCTTAASIIRKHHQSCVVGHQQGKDIAYAKRADGTTITAIIAGSFYEHKERYMDWQTNQHWRGCVMLHEVHDGSFDEMFVSLSYLKRRYA